MVSISKNDPTRERFQSGDYTSNARTAVTAPTRIHQEDARAFDSVDLGVRANPSLTELPPSLPPSLTILPSIRERRVSRRHGTDLKAEFPSVARPRNPRIANPGNYSFLGSAEADIVGDWSGPPCHAGRGIDFGEQRTGRSVHQLRAQLNPERATAVITSTCLPLSRTYNAHTHAARTHTHTYMRTHTRGEFGKKRRRQGWTRYLICPDGVPVARRRQSAKARRRFRETFRKPTLTMESSSRLAEPAATSGSSRSPLRAHPPCAAAVRLFRREKKRRDFVTRTTGDTDGARPRSRQKHVARHRHGTYTRSHGQTRTTVREARAAV